MKFSINKDIYHDHVIKLLRYWERAKDNENGGFHSWIRPDGRVHEHRFKSLLIQSRLLYNYSEGIRLGAAFAEPYAAELYDFITQRLKRPDGWYASYRENNLYPSTLFDAYANLFVVIGMARYAHATGRSGVKEEAIQLFNLIEKHTIGNDVSETGVTGDLREIEYERASVHPYAGNLNLHYLEALICLFEAGFRENYEAKIRAIRQFFLNKVLNREFMVTYDRYKKSYDIPRTEPGTIASMGHSVEWIDFFRCIPGFELDEAMERGILDSAIERCIQPDGLFQDQFFFGDNRTAGGATFWPQVEAIKMFYRAAHIYGSPYDEHFWRMNNFYFDHFIDSDTGIFTHIDRNGVILNRYKGNGWKCDYHSIRMCVGVLELTC